MNGMDTMPGTSAAPYPGTHVSRSEVDTRLADFAGKLRAARDLGDTSNATEALEGYVHVLGWVAGATDVSPVLRREVAPARDSILAEFREAGMVSVLPGPAQVYAGGAYEGLAWLLGQRSGV